jgi:3-oxoacyl-[acyl-carrier protein] reductase
MGFEDQVVLVTGASRGIGRAIAAAFAVEKALVIINDISSEESLGEMRHAPPFNNRRTRTIRADIGNSDEVKRMFEEIDSSYGRLDILVNNAGIIRRGNVETVTEQEWDDVLRVNLKGTFNCSKAAAQMMMRQGHGKMINISSIAAKLGDITSAPGYGPSKAAIDALTKTFARQLAGYGINVNGVAPHAIETDMSAEWSEEKRKAIVEAIPLKKLGQPDDVAEAVLFLASDKAGFITGEILDVNGGFVMD